MAPSGCILSCFGRKKKQQEEPQTSNGLNKPFRCLKQLCCIGKIPTQSSEQSASANNEPSASADNPAPMIHPFGPEVVGNTANYPEIASLLATQMRRRRPTQPSETIQDSENNEPSTSADNPAHLIHPYGPEVAGNTADYPTLPNQSGFPRFTDPEIASLLASPIWRMLGENVPNELGIIRSTLFNFGSPMLRLFYMSGLVPPEIEGGSSAGLLDANRVRWVARLRNLPPRGIGLDYEDFATHYRLFARDYVYLLETDNPHKMLLVFMRRNSLTRSFAAWFVPYYQVGLPSSPPYD